MYVMLIENSFSIRVMYYVSILQKSNAINICPVKTRYKIQDVCVHIEFAICTFGSLSCQLGGYRVFHISNFQCIEYTRTCWINGRFWCGWVVRCNRLIVKYVHNRFCNVYENQRVLQQKKTVFKVCCLYPQKMIHKTVFTIFFNFLSLCNYLCLLSHAIIERAERCSRVRL